MQTVLTQKIDGLDIITGFGKLSIEPVETRKKVALIAPDAPEMQAAKAKRLEIQEALKQAHAASQSNQGTREDRYAAYLGYLRNAKALEGELKPLIQAEKSKLQELMQTHAEYFEPRAGEIALSDAKIAPLKAAFAKGLTDLNGVKIEDNRGAIHCLLSTGVWKITRVLTLGEKIPSKAILYNNLDDAQRAAVTLQMEKDRAQLMSGGEKIKAKASDTSKAVQEAAMYRSELEIQEDPDPLGKSQEKYKARISELGEIYDDISA